MFLSYQHANADSGMWNRYLRAGLLALCLGLFSAAAWAWETVLFEDHFDEEYEGLRENWDLYGGLDDVVEQMLNFGHVPGVCRVAKLMARHLAIPTDC